MPRGRAVSAQNKGAQLATRVARSSSCSQQQQASVPIHQPPPASSPSHAPPPQHTHTHLFLSLMKFATMKIVSQSERLMLAESGSGMEQSSRKDVKALSGMW